MKSSIRILTIGLALALLLVVPATFMGTATAADGDTVSLSQDEVEWVKTGTNVESGYFSPGPDGTSKAQFYLRDDGLTTTVTASTTITGKLGKPFSLRHETVTAPTTLDVKNIDAGITDGSRTRPTGWVDKPAVVPDPPTVADPGPAGDQDKIKAYTDYLAAKKDYEEYQGKLAKRAEILEELQAEENERAHSDQYQYKSGDNWLDWDEVHEGRRYSTVSYTDDVLNETTPDVGGELRPVTIITRATLTVVGKSPVGVATHITDADTGTFTVFGHSETGGTSATLKVEFTYNIVDVYSTVSSNADSTLDYVSGYRRAKVTSDSDSVGEWVEISEVASSGSAANSATANYYLGEVTLSDDADDSRSGDANVWVQDGDTLTVTVYSSNDDTNSSAIASATAKIDDLDPEISAIMPAGGTLLNKGKEVISVRFTIEDSGSGFDINERDDNIESVQVKNFVFTQDPEDPDILIGDFKKVGICEQTGEGADDNPFTYPRVTASSIDVVYAPNATPNTWNADAGCNVDSDSVDHINNSHGLPFKLEISAKDKAGNVATKSVELRLDSEKPKIETGNVEAGKGWDASDEKVVTQRDAILVKFNESLNPATVDADDFNVVGFQVVSAEVVGVNEDADPIVPANQHRNEYVVLTLSEDLAPDSKPKAGLVGAVEDEAGNVRSGSSSKPYGEIAAKNKLKPSVTVEAFTALLAKGGTQTISYTADESLRLGSADDKQGTRVSVSGRSGATADRGVIAISLTSPTEAEGTFKQKTISGTGIYGVVVQARDRDNNATDEGATKVTEEDVSDDVSGMVAGGGKIHITPSKWPIADHDADGTLTDTFSLMVNGADAISTTTAINWETGKVTMTVAEQIPADASVKVTYYYVDAAQVIQVDTKAPSASFTPADGESTDDTTPFIQINFDDDEYAGDTHKTVMLTAATLKATDGTPTDIMDSISTTDNIEFIYVATEELALGEYEITVSATDEAGNELKEESSTFTVKARAKTTIALQPSWNLISLRGAPVSLDINDIITDPSIETVSSYDPSLASPWTVWIRGADGMLESSPAGRTRINPGHALWVRSNTGQDLEVDIPGLSRDDVAALPPTIALVQGWNLVAAASIDPSVKTLDPDVYFAGLNWVRVYEFNALTGRLEGALPSSSASDIANNKFMEVGKGYWVYLTEAGTVIP